MADYTSDEITGKVKIISTDDSRIKSFGELLTNDSGRRILELLFNYELTAAQIAQKTGISLQLVKYHLNKMQALGVVNITKVEKNSKSHDMKFYSAEKFSIVIVPPKLSEKTKESKLLVRSFRHIYRVAGLGLATGMSALLSASQLSTRQAIVPDEAVQQQFQSSGVGESSQDTVLEGAAPQESSEPSLRPDSDFTVTDDSGAEVSSALTESAAIPQAETIIEGDAMGAMPMADTEPAGSSEQAIPLEATSGAPAVTPETTDSSEVEMQNFAPSTKDAESMGGSYESFSGGGGGGGGGASGGGSSSIAGTMADTMAEPTSMSVQEGSDSFQAIPDQGLSQDAMVQNFDEPAIDEGSVHTATDAESDQVLGADLDDILSEQSGLVAQDDPVLQSPEVPAAATDAPMADLGALATTTSFHVPDLFWPLISLTAVLGGMTIFYAARYLRVRRIPA